MLGKAPLGCDGFRDSVDSTRAQPHHPYLGSWRDDRMDHPSSTQKPKRPFLFPIGRSRLDAAIMAIARGDWRRRGAWDQDFHTTNTTTLSTDACLCGPARV